MAAQFPSLAAFPVGIGGSPFPSNQHILNQQQAITANGPSSTSSFQPSSFLINNFQSSIASSVPSSSLSPFMMPSPFSSIPHNNQPPPMVSIGNSSSSSSAPFNGFMRPSSSSRPIAQLRRASSASMEAAGKYGNNGTSRAAQQNGFGGGGAFGGGGNRPASLQHHELLLYNNGGDGQPQSQRTTPLPRKFDSMEQMALVLEEERSAAQQEEEEEEEEEMMKSSPNRRREKTGDELMEQPISIGQNHHPHHHSLPPPSLPLLPPPSSHPHSSHPPASAPLAVAPSLRRNSSLTSNFSSGSSKGPHSALPSGVGPYPMFSSNPLPSTAAPPLQSTCGSNANNVDSNVTLWQFLLELLAANDHPNLIQWTNNEGEFKLHDAEAVARLWGIRKGKPNMNYDKLSRALRYYYDKNIIKKVIGQKFVYRFVMDNKQAGGIAECAGAPGNPELVKYAMTKAGLNVNNGNGNANGIAQPSRGQMEAARFGHSSSFHPICSTASENFPPSRVTPSMTESSKSIGNSLNTLNPNGCGAQSSRNANVATLTPSPATSSCSPTGSVESSSGVSSGSGISGFAVPNGLNGTLGHLMGLGQIKQEPGLSLPSAHQLHNSVATTSSASPYNPVERARTTRKRKSPSEMQQARMEGGGEEAPYIGMPNGRGGGSQQIQQDDASAPKIGCSANTAGPSLSRRARPQPLDLTTVNNSSSAMSNLTGQMSQMVAASPLLLALQQHNLQQQQQQQQSPLLSAAINALSNYAASPMASVASPLAQAAAFQLASNLVASLSPNINSSNQNANNNNSGINNAGLINYPLANNGATMAPASAAGSSGNPLNVATTSSLYSQLHSALTTPIAANQVKTPQQHFSNSAMISAVINHLANGPNTPFAQQQQQQQMQQQPSLFQFPPTSNMAIAHTLAMLSSPGLPLAGQSPFPFMSQMAALQTPKMPNFPSGFNQRSPDSLKTPMGGLNFEFGQVLAAAAANKK